MTERLPSGVRAYHGDDPIPFSEGHRQNLGRGYYKMDLDGVEIIGMAMETEGNVFHGYTVADSRFATVAVFDLKKSESAIYCEHNKVRHMYQVHLCRSMPQPIPPVFAYMVGDGPFLAYRVDLESGAVSERPVTIPASGSWAPAWADLGIIEAKQVLSQWLTQKCDVTQHKPLLRGY